MGKVLITAALETTHFEEQALLQTWRRRLSMASQEIESAAAPTVGCSIWIFWPDEKQWFEGTVSASTGRKHQVITCRSLRSDGSSSGSAQSTVHQAAGKVYVASWTDLRLYAHQHSAYCISVTNLGGPANNVFRSCPLLYCPGWPTCTACRFCSNIALTDPGLRPVCLLDLCKCS